MTVNLSDCPALFGRLLIWQLALEDVTELLQQARRAVEAEKQPNILEEEKKRGGAFKEFVRNNKGFVLDRYLKKYEQSLGPRLYPTTRDLYQIQDTCWRLAVVIFDQIFGPGYPDRSGAIATNTHPYLKSVRKEMFAYVESQGIGRKDLMKTLKLLAEIRNKEIAHVDGDALDMRHEPSQTTHLILGFRINTELDVELWEKVVNMMTDFVVKQRIILRQMMEGTVDSPL